MLWVALETPGARSRALPILQDAVEAIDPGLPVARTQTMAEVFLQENAEERAFGTLFASFGLAALLLAVAGVSGVVSFSISRRTQEIGIRRALGASSPALFVEVVRRGLRSALIGVAASMGAGFLLAPLLGELLYGWNPHDSWTYTLVPLSLLAICLLAASSPARRALRLQPVAALRTE